MKMVSLRTVLSIVLVAAISGCDSSQLLDSDDEIDTPPEVSISLSAEYSDGSVIPVFRSSTDTTFSQIVDPGSDQYILPGSRFDSEGTSLLLEVVRWPGAQSGSLISLDLISGTANVLGDRNSFPIASTIRQSPGGTVAFRRKEPGISTQWSVAVLDSELNQAPGTSQEWVAGWAPDGSVLTMSDTSHMVYWYTDSLIRNDSLALDDSIITSRVGSNWRAYHPDLDRDGSQIVFSVSAAGSLSQLAVVDLSSGQTRWVTQESTDHEDLPVWGPRGEVYFLSYDGSFGTHFNSSVKTYSVSGNRVLLTTEEEIEAERIHEVSVSW
jgi:hypothetical protein